jgi:hypothetical protein
LFILSRNVEPESSEAPDFLETPSVNLTILSDSILALFSGVAKFGSDSVSLEKKLTIGVGVGKI